MERPQVTDADRTDQSDQHDVHYYLPATPSMSTEPGPVERFLTSLFRRRGRYRLVDEGADESAWR